MYYLGIDPGRDKCGVAVLDKEGRTHDHFVAQTKELVEHLQTLQIKYQFTDIVLGNGTYSDKIALIVQKTVCDVPVKIIDEYMTTLKAREQYWKLYPPKGLWKFIPTSLRVPPAPYDDIVAIILVEKYLSNKIRS